MWNLQNNRLKTILLFLLVVSVLIVLLIVLTNRPKTFNSATGEFVTVKDDLGRKVTYRYPPLKIASLAPSITEILFSICPSELIIARTQNCNYPQEALHKQVVNNYPINFEQLATLKPDLVITQDGMISLKDADRLQQLGVAVYIVKINSVAEILIKIKKIGQLINYEAIAKTKSDSLSILIDNLKADSTKKRSVLMIISADPLYVFGHDNYASDMLKYAGGINAIDATISQPFPLISREYLLNIDPETIIASDSMVFKQLLNKYPETKNLKAYKAKRLKLVNEDLISRPSPRVFETITEIIKAINN